MRPLLPMLKILADFLDDCDFWGGPCAKGYSHFEFSMFFRWLFFHDLLLFVFLEVAFRLALCLPFVSARLLKQFKRV